VNIASVQEYLFSALMHAAKSQSAVGTKIGVEALCYKSSSGLLNRPHINWWPGTALPAQRAILGGSPENCTRIEQLAKLP
jgi:hypothetical protein